MLKKLARWLRIFGVRVEYAEMSDKEILELLGKHPKKILLTQDVQLHERALGRRFRSFLVPREVSIAEQIAAVFRKFGLRIEDFPSKTVCPDDNGELRTVGRREVEGKVLPAILARHSTFWLCKKCGKIYWEGSHWRRIGETAEKVRKLLSGPASPPPAS